MWWLYIGAYGLIYVNIVHKAFSELQMKILEMNQKVKVSEGQIANLKRDSARCELTNKELSEMPVDTDAYEAVGRM